MSAKEHPTVSSTPLPAHSRRPLLPALLVGVGVLALLALLAYGLSIQGRQSIGGVPVRNQFGEVDVRPKPAFSFALGLLDPPGGQFLLEEQRGKLVLLDFWASWCPPCRDEAPGLERVWKQYQERGVSFLGVNVFDDREAALAYVKEYGLTYPNAPDPTGEVAIEYGLAGVPEKFLIGRDGQLIRRFVGPMSEDTLRRLLDDQLRG
jgi:cytochrome c biogenesis protein CcmG, thiol:disulfide interchange protein DsbE